MSKVETKIEEYRKSDVLERAKRGTEPTMSVMEAMMLLKDSRGFCACCECKLIMHSWPSKPANIPAVLVRNGYEKQFSFDRIDDNRTHCRENIRITCLQCNIANADAKYQPDYEISSGNTMYAAWEEYEYIKQAFNELERVCIRGKTKAFLDADIWKYHRALKSYMAYLHDLIYADRKINNWKKFGVVADSSQPHLRILTKSYAQYNREYYLAARVGDTPPSASLGASTCVHKLDQDEIDAWEKTVA